MGRHLRNSPLLLLGIAVVTCMTVIDARRMGSSPPRHEVPQVTPSEPIVEGGWRPVIDSRISYEPSHQHAHLMTGPSGPTGPEARDQTVDLVPPPYQAPKTNKKNTATTRVPNLKGKNKGAFSELSTSETRGSPSGAFTIPPPEQGPSGPSRPMRFPDEKRRNNVRRRPAAHHHHHHHHNDHHHSEHNSDRNRNNFKVRQNNYAAAESTQHFRFRPSPQVAPTYENSFPSWLAQSDDQSQAQQQQQTFYNPENSALLQLQQQFSPEAQYQLAVSQQQTQPEVASQFQQQQSNAGFLPGTTQVFGNAGIFNLNPDLQKNGNLFLASAATEPSVHENEVPQGPQVYVSHTTRGRPIFDIATGIPKFPITEPTVPSFQQQDISDYRPRRPRPPSGIQSHLETTRIPVLPDENIRPSRPDEVIHQDDNVEITKLRPRHPRPPSTEPPSWSHPVLEGEPIRQRRPRPPQQQQTEPEAPRIRRPSHAQQQAEHDTPRRRPRPPVQDQAVEQQEEPRPRRPLRPSIQDNDWKPSTSVPDHPEPVPQVPQEVDVDVTARKPRPPPPVEETVEDDVERPVFTLRPRRPQPIREPEQNIEEEQPVQRPRRPRPPVEAENYPRPEENKQQEVAQAQEDVDESVNIRPRRPRPPEIEERPRPHVRRPRPPAESMKRRRPRPPVQEEEEVVEHKRRRPALRPEDHEDRKQNRRPASIKTSFEEERDASYAVVESEETQEETAPPVYGEIISEAPTVEVVPETTPLPVTTTTQPPPSIPSKRRRPIIKPMEPEFTEEVTENYPVNFRVTTESIITTQPPPTTTEPPSTTKSLINNRLRTRLNSTRPRFSVSGSYKDRVNRLSALSNKNNEDATAAPSANAEISRTHTRNRESSRFKLGTPVPTTEETATERTTFRPNMSRYSRPGNKFYSRYRATTEEPATTAALHDATRRTSDDIFSVKQRRPFPLKSNNPEQTQENDMSVTSMSFTANDISTMTPTDEIGTTPMAEQNEETTETPTTFPPEPAPTPAEDFSPARRVTDLTSSATAFKPLSFFSAVPANGKHASQLSSRFTMATEDPILPIQAFFPTFTSKPNKNSDSVEDM